MQIDDALIHDMGQQVMTGGRILENAWLTHILLHEIDSQIGDGWP